MLYIASDHAGFEFKNQIVEGLKNLKIEINDLGPWTYEPTDDYVDYAQKLCERLAPETDKNKGILICNSGEGMMIIANKYKGIYATLALNSREAVLSRQHNDSNVLILSSSETSHDLAISTIVLPWLNTDFSNHPRHIRRINKIKLIENKNFK